MKITRVETIILSRLHEPERQWVTATVRVIKADCAIVLVHTDEGLTGIGEACAYGNPARIKEWAAWLERKDKGVPFDEVERKEFDQLKAELKLGGYRFPWEKQP